MRRLVLLALVAGCGTEQLPADNAALGDWGLTFPVDPPACPNQFGTFAAHIDVDDAGEYVGSISVLNTVSIESGAADEVTITGQSQDVEMILTLSQHAEPSAEYVWTGTDGCEDADYLLVEWHQ